MIQLDVIKDATSLKKEETAKVKGFRSLLAASKFLSLGITPGARIKMMQINSLAGGYCLKINGRSIALRKNEAKEIVLID